jgi:anti-sigma B factor antagonist
MDRLEITEYHPGEEHVLVVRGELDIATAPKLCRCMTPLRSCKVTLDLAGLTFCDSTGLRALLGESREAHICGGRVRYKLPEGGIVRRLFDVCGVEPLFTR